MYCAGADGDDPPPMAIDWTPPTTFGVDNSVRLVDAYNEEAAKRRGDGEDAEGEVRVMRSRRDIKKGEMIVFLWMSHESYLFYWFSY